MNSDNVLRDTSVIAVTALTSTTFMVFGTKCCSVNEKLYTDFMGAQLVYQATVDQFYCPVLITLQLVLTQGMADRHNAAAYSWRPEQQLRCSHMSYGFRIFTQKAVAPNGSSVFCEPPATASSRDQPQDKSSASSHPR